MSNFSALFKSYSSTADYDMNRDSILEEGENAVYSGTYGSGQPGQQLHTLGYGYDFSQQTGAAIISAFQSAGLYGLLSSAQITALQNYNDTAATNPAAYTTELQSVDTAFTGFTLTQPQAVSLLNAVASVYENTVTKTAFNNNLTSSSPIDPTGNNSLHALLLSEDYNGGNVFGPMQAYAIAQDNVPAFIENVLFFNSTAEGIYNQGVENRRIKDFAAAIGVLYADNGGLDKNYVVTGLEFGGAVIAAIQVYDALTMYASAISTEITLLGGTASTNLNGFIFNTENAALSTVNTQVAGYYIVQPGNNTWDSIAIASNAGVSGARLQAINTAFADATTNVSAGGLVHVPIESISGNTSLPSLPSGETYVVDPSSQTVYIVGMSLDGHDNGALVIDQPATLGQPNTFSPDSYSGVSFDTTNASPIVNVTAPDGTVLFSYDTDASVTFADGTQVNLPAVSGVTLTDNLSASATPEQLTLSYLSQLGDPLTATQLDQDNDNFLNPSATPVTVQGTISTNPNSFAAQITGSQATDTFNATTNDAIIAGTTQPVTFTNSQGIQVQAVPTNVLFAGGDITQDTISNIQEVVIGNTTMTAAQFNSFRAITVSPEIVFPVTLTIADGGTASLQSGNFVANPVSNVRVSLAASGWEGTTLIANEEAGQALTASLFGNDTLIAGDNVGDILTAGEGIDTLTGSTAGITSFVAYNGLAAGSVIQGYGAGNGLQASGDIGGATITGVQTLYQNGNLALDGTELNSFSVINNTAGRPGTITLTTGGTYDIGNQFTLAPDMVAGSNSGTTLIGTGNFNGVLTASVSGNDTLQAGNGSSVTLNAGGGGDTLIAGSGSDTLNGGIGDDVLIAGTGSDILTDGYGYATGYESYEFGASFGQDVLYNSGLFGHGGSAMRGEIDFMSSAITYENLWFTQSGSDLVIQLLGTTDTITVKGWFGGDAGAEVQTFNADGLSLGNTAVAALVSAMATYQSNNPSFNPATAAGMPIDTGLQSALTTAWFGDVGTTVISEYGLFQNANSGQVYEWQLNGTSVIASSFVGNNTDPAWQVVGTGDFTGNGNADILFQNSSSGQVYEWLMNGFSVTGGGVAGNNTDPSWQVVGTGDFTGNGIDDILFQNASNGQVYEWEMNGTSVIGSGFVGNNTDSSWKVVGTGDFTGNGIDDVLFQNASSGQVYEWEMNGTSVVGGGVVGNNTDPAWQVVGIGDFTGTGIDDILFQNVNSGQVYEWEMNGTSVIGSGVVGNNTDPTWHVVGTGDFTGNGVADILFQNSSSGQVYEWLMNGLSVIGGGAVGNNTDPTWHAVAKS